MEPNMVCKSDHLSEAAMGRIALKLLLQSMVEQKKIPNAEFRTREVPNIAKAIGEKPEELQEFVRCITPAIIGRVVGCQEVGLAKWTETGPHQSK